MNMSFETISDDDHEDYEVWTCERCGHQVTLAGVGGDVAECPECLRREYEAEADQERENAGMKRYDLTMQTIVWGNDDEDARDSNYPLVRDLTELMRRNGYRVQIEIKKRESAEREQHEHKTD
jgi:hypothetical protein